MSFVSPDDPTQPQNEGIPMPSPEDLARVLATPSFAVDPAPSRVSMRGKLIGAVAIAAIGIGASVMSCVGQSFSLRQARALEAIEQQLQQLRASCVAAPQPKIEEVR